MAILDAKLELSDAQAVTTTAASTNVIDFGAGIPDVGGGVGLWLVADVGVTFAGGTSISVKIEDSADNSTFGTRVTGETVALADAVAGKRLLLAALPPVSKRYMRVTYTVVGTMSAGSVNCYVTPFPPTA